LQTEHCPAYRSFGKKKVSAWNFRNAALNNTFAGYKLSRNQGKADAELQDLQTIFNDGFLSNLESIEAPERHCKNWETLT
jgi:hypothetical protein